VLSKDARVTLSSESEVRAIKRVGDGYDVTYLDRRGTNPMASCARRRCAGFPRRRRSRHHRNPVAVTP